MKYLNVVLLALLCSMLVGCVGMGGGTRRNSGYYQDFNYFPTNYQQPTNCTTQYVGNGSYGGNAYTTCY